MISVFIITGQSVTPHFFSHKIYTKLGVALQVLILLTLGSRRHLYVGRSAFVCSGHHQQAFANTALKASWFFFLHVCFLSPQSGLLTSP